MVPDRRRLWMYLAVGVAIGGAYAVVDTLLDARILRGPLLGMLAPAHALVDHVLPVLTGALLGAVVFALGQRGRLAASERKRAEALRVRLEKVERDQAVWVLAATVLHEVKNPLHSLGLLLDELAANPSRPAELVERAQAQIARISEELQLLRSLQTQSQAHRSKVPLDELAATLADDLGPTGIQLDVEAESPVLATADASHVRLILENLVENAVQAARVLGTQGRTSIAVRREGRQAVVLVHDNGAGPSPAVVARLFDPLHSTKPAGLGLGLAVSRALARAMDGDLLYDGHLDDRTTFKLVLPLEPP